MAVRRSHAPTTARLAQASRAAREADAEQRLSEARRVLRAPVRAIDLLLDDLERINLEGGARADAPAVAAWLDQVEAEVGVPAPRWVHQAPDTARMHAAVLRWQGTILDHVRPERREYADMHDDPVDLLLFPRPLYGPMPAAARQRAGRDVA